MKSDARILFYLAAFLVYVAIRGVFKRRVKNNINRVQRLDLLERFLIILVIPGSLLLPLIHIFGNLLSFADYRLPAVTGWIGAALMVAALWLFYRSHSDLGKNWSVTLAVREGHTLVKHGVYRSIRHPMYASIWLWCIAQGLLLENWLAGWYALASFAVMYFVRTPREEQLMRDCFGQEYEEYMRNTGRLFPRRTRCKSPGGNRIV